MATITADHKALRESLMVAPPASFVEWLNFFVYGDVGVGKTYLMGTADDDPRTSPLLVIDVEGGLLTIKDRGNVDVKSLRTVKELEDLYNKTYAKIKDGKLPYKTIGIDSLPELQDLDMRIIMTEAYGKSPDKVDKDVPSPREWGKSRSHIRSIVRAFRDLPCNTIMTAQVGSLQEEGQPTKFFPGLSGKLRTEIPGFMDIVGYLYAEVEPGTGVVNRRLQVQGTRRVVAKDRTSSLGDIVENPTIPMLWDMIHTGGNNVGS